MNLRTCLVFLAVIAFAAALPTPNSDETLQSEESRHGWGGYGYGNWGGYGYGPQWYGGYGPNVWSNRPYVHGGYGGYGGLGGYGVGIGIGYGNIW